MPYYQVSFWGGVCFVSIQYFTSTILFFPNVALADGYVSILFEDKANPIENVERLCNAIPKCLFRLLSFSLESGFGQQYSLQFSPFVEILSPPRILLYGLWPSLRLITC